MSKLKVGDICRVKKGYESECGVYYNLNSAFIKITQIDSDGDFYYDILNSKKEKINSCSQCFKEEHLEKFIPTLRDAVEGDILVDEDGDDRMVLLRNEYLAILSKDYDHKISDTFLTWEEMEKMGYKLKGQEEETVDDKMKEAMDLLKSNGYKIVKE